MELTIEQYVQQIYTIRSNLDETTKYNIETIHSEVADRMTFEIPLHHINAFDVNTCIVTLDKGKHYYHIVDHSMFDYFIELLGAFEGRQPHLASAIYSQLRHDICMSQQDEVKAQKYQIPIYVTPYDLEVEKERESNPIDLTNRFSFMARFYFLHEYAHFLIVNPVRKNTNFAFVDGLIDIFVENMIDHSKSLSRKQGNNGFDDIYISMILNYQKEYRNNIKFREEIICDIQSIFVLLELAEHFSTKLIFESILAFVYTQYFVWLAKRMDKDLELGNIFHFRINVLVHFAYMLEDTDFSNAMCSILNSNNRFLNLSNIQCEPIDLDKFQKFYEAYTKLMLLDRQDKLSGASFVGDFDSDILDMKNMKPHTTYMFSKNEDGSYTRTKLDTPQSRKRRLEELHNNAIKEASINGRDYLDYLSLKSGGTTLEEIDKYYKRMYRYIKKRYPSFFETHPSLISKATTTTLFIWEREGRIFI